MSYTKDKSTNNSLTGIQYINTAKSSASSPTLNYLSDNPYDQPLTINYSSDYQNTDVTQSTTTFTTDNCNNSFDNTNYWLTDRKSEQKQFEIESYIRSGNKIMILMRGLPGSGKTTLARKIVDRTLNSDYKKFIYSTDDYFYDSHGNYKHCADRLGDAHRFNQRRVSRAIFKQRIPTIFIDNTNIYLKDMYFYVKMAILAGYIVKILESGTSWYRSAYICSRKTVHKVPLKTIEKMLNKYEKIGDSIDIIKYFNLTGLTRQVGRASATEIDQVNSWSSAPISEVTRTEDVTNNNNNDILKDINKSVETGYFLPGGKRIQINERKPTSEETPQPPRTRNNKKCKNNNNNNSELMLTNVNSPTDFPDSNLDTLVLSAKEMEDQRQITHKPSCPIGNRDFYTLCEIYPNTAVDALWDLFNKCNSSLDWTMDILLNDSSKIENSELISRDFHCDCHKTNNVNTNNEAELHETDIKPISRSNSLLSVPDLDGDRCSVACMNRSISDPSIPVNENSLGPINTNRSNSLSNISCSNSNTSSPVKEMSTSTEPTTSTGTKPKRYSDPMSSDKDSDSNIGIDDNADDDDDDDEDDELVNLNLGDELANNLFSLFGDGAVGGTELSKLSKNVFIRKTMARKLYLLLLESMANQMEEERFENLKKEKDYPLLLTNEFTSSKIKRKKKKTNS